MEKPKPKVDGMRTYFDVREMTAYLAEKDREIATWKAAAERWKLQALGPR
jgi:hypothetical protein